MNRYLRQTILPQVGECGQRALKNSKVLLVGAGGLGLPCAQSLVAAGVGQLTIIDDDVVSLTNLQRQVLFCEKDLGRAKVEVAVERLSAQNREVEVCGVTDRFKIGNARELIAKQDLIVDGSDNFATKFLMNDACLLEKKPWIYGSISRFEGQVATFSPEGGSCYRCLYEKTPVSKIENCAEQGVFGAVTGIIGNYQALEALKAIISGGGGSQELRPHFGVLRVFDFLSLEQQTLLIPQRRDCVCRQPQLVNLKEEAEVCGFEFKKSWREFEEDAGNKRLFDVRTEEEYQKNHHPLGKLWDQQNAGSLPPSRPGQVARIYLYCLTGRRALAQCVELRKKGVAAFYIADKEAKWL